MSTAVLKIALFTAQKAKDSNLLKYFCIGLLILLLLFISFACSLGFTFTVIQSPGNSDLSNTVSAYRSAVTEIATQYNIPEYVNLILAVMQQESGGQGSDPMQASECEYNTEYEQKPNSITDPLYSIQCGIQELRDCLHKADVKAPNDTQSIELALQGYNYGIYYIVWAQWHGGYSLTNAGDYSNMLADTLGWTSYGDPYYVPHVLRYYKAN